MEAANMSLAFVMAALRATEPIANLDWPKEPRASIPPANQSRWSP